MYDKDKCSERFWSKVYIPDDPDGCWLWLAYKDTAGYGRFYSSELRRSAPAPRVSYYLTYGEYPSSDMHVCHRCDNPSCVRPDHLFVDTPAGNQHDRNRKGRQARGERNGRAKLNEDIVREIRYLYSKGVSVAELARQYGVTNYCIFDVVHRRNWRYLN